METGGKGKIVRPQKTKFRESDADTLNIKQKQKSKKRDKSVLRLLRQEREYVI